MDDIPQPGSLEAEAGVFCSTFDVTGTRLITGGADKTIKVLPTLQFFMIMLTTPLADLRRTVAKLVRYLYTRSSSYSICCTAGWRYFLGAPGAYHLLSTESRAAQEMPPLTSGLRYKTHLPDEGR